MSARDRPKLPFSRKHGVMIRHSSVRLTCRSRWTNKISTPPVRHLSRSQLSLSSSSLAVSLTDEFCSPPLHFLVMPEFFESIPDHIIPWLLEQHVFWVASAPLSKDGHVNLSPKGLKGSFRVNNPNEVWYEDLMGSGKLTSLLP